MHREDGVPIQLEDRFVNVSFAPDLLAQDFTAMTPSAYLSAIAPLTEAEQAVSEIIPSAIVRNHLQMAHISQRRDLHDDKLMLAVRNGCSAAAYWFVEGASLGSHQASPRTQISEFRGAIEKCVSRIPARPVN